MTEPTASAASAGRGARWTDIMAHTVREIDTTLGSEDFETPTFTVDKPHGWLARALERQSYSPLIGHLTWVPNASPQSLLGESPVPCSWSHLLARGPVTVAWRTPAESADVKTPVEE